MGREKVRYVTDKDSVRRKNVRDHFLTYSQALRPWLAQISQKYKEEQNFPLYPMVILPSYYTDIRDKEIAAFVSLLIPETDNIVKNVGEIRDLLGQNPFEWFRNRGFVSLGTGSKQNKRTGGVENWKIAKLLDRLWEQCEITTNESPMGETYCFMRPIGFQVEAIADAQRCSYFDVLTYLLEDCCVGNYFYKLRLLLLVLGTSDGFGLGLWAVSPDELKSPLTHDLRTFLQTWFPDYRRFGTIDEAIHEFGLERDCDFFYCWLAYKELQKKSPKVCGNYATLYQRWYEIGARKKPYEFRDALPDTTKEG